MHFRFDKEKTKPEEYDHPLTPELNWVVQRWRLVEATGWPLEYIDQLSYDDVIQWLAVKTAEAKAQDKPKGGGKAPGVPRRRGRRRR